MFIFAILYLPIPLDVLNAAMDRGTGRALEKIAAITDRQRRSSTSNCLCNHSNRKQQYNKLNNIDMSADMSIE